MRLLLLIPVVLLAGLAATVREKDEPAQVRVAAIVESEAPEAPEPVATPRPRPKVVEPVAGQVSASEPEDPAEGLDLEEVPETDDTTLPKPRGSASGGGGTRRTSDVNDDPNQAFALKNGVALPPLEAPEAVLEVIRAGNSIARTPYKWGGGHGRFLDDGYDCSGSVSYALYSAGLIEGPRTSGGLKSWGKPGKGRWITIYTHDGHVFMEVAGIRFDTSGTRRTGSRWQNDLRPHNGFIARHPPGL